MLKNWRSLTAFFSFLIKEATLDPNGLALKVKRKTGFPTPKRKFMTEAEIAEDLGEYTQAIRLADYACSRPIYSWRNLLVRLRCKQRLEWFKYPIVPSGPKKSSSRGKSFIYVCGNSLPYTTSGYSKRTQSLLEALNRRGLKVIAQTRLNYPAEVGFPRFATEDSVNGVTYHRNLTAIQPVTVRQYVQCAASGVGNLLKRTDAALVHTTTSFTNAIVVSRAAWSAKIPWVYEMRGEIEKTWLATPTRSGLRRSEDSEHYRLARMKETEAAHAAAGVVVLSEVARTGLIERGIPAAKILVAPNAAESDLFVSTLSQEEAKRRLNLKPDKTVVGSVTSVVPYEGLDLLLRALQLLPDSYEGLIVGDGSDLPRLKKLSVDLSIGHRVRFVGKQTPEDIVKWYKALDVFVVPRRDEPVCRTVTPIKPLAAMALGVPVVASNLPALREVTGGQAEFCVPDDPADLARAIERWQTIDVRKAREWAEGRTWEHVGEHVADFYRTLIRNV